MDPKEQEAASEYLQDVPEEERAAALEYLTTPTETAQEPQPDIEINVDESAVKQLSTPDKGFDLGGAVQDVAIGIPEAIGKGAVNSVGETLEGIYSLADGAANLVGQDLPDKEYTPYEAETQTGKVLEPIARFVTGFVGAGKFLKMAGWAGKAGPLLNTARVAVQGGLADFFTFDGHEARLSNLIQENPNLKNPISDFLAAKPEDGEAVGRLKNAVEGLGLGIATDGLITALKNLKHIRALRSTVGDVKAAQEIATNADAFDEGLDTLFPNKRVEGRVISKDKPIHHQTKSEYFGDVPGDDKLGIQVSPTKEGGKYFLTNANKGVREEVTAEEAEALAKAQRMRDIGLHQEASVLEAETTRKIIDRLGKGSEWSVSYNLHREAIERAIGNGEEVPLNVLKEYPDLYEKTHGTLPTLTDEAGQELTYTPPINKDKAVAYAKEVNRVLEEGGDPTKINLTPYMNPEAFQSPEQIEQLINTVVATIRDTDKVISNKMSIEEAEKMFSGSIANLADIAGVSKESLSQKLLQDSENIREAGIRSVVAGNALQAIELRINELLPAADNLDEEALRQIELLREAYYRIIPGKSSVGSELGRALQLQKVEPTFGQEAADLLKNNQMSTQEWMEAYRKAKNSHARAKTFELLGDTITRVRINSMLSGPVTQMVNISSNLFKTALSPAEYVLGGLSQKALGKSGGDQAIKQGLGIYRGLWAAQADAWRMAGSAIKNRKGVFRGGDFSQLDVFGDLSKVENVVSDSQDALKYGSLEDLKQSSELIQEAMEQGDYGKLVSQVWSTGIRTLGAVVDIPSTLLNGADEFFLNLNGRAVLYQGLTEKGLSQGLNGQELASFVEDGMQKYFTKNGELIQNDELGKQAFAYATDSNFSKELTDDTIFGKVGQSLREVQTDEGGYGFAMQQIAPFVRTPANLIEDVFNHVPGVNALLNKAVRDDLAAGGLRQAKRIGEMTTGAMFLSTAAALVSQGVITGSGPTDPAIRQTMMKTGWKPYSVKLPDGNYFEISRFEPYSTYFTVLADYMEAKQAGDRGDDEEFYKKLVASAANNLTSKKYLTGLIDTMDLLSGLGHGDFESLEKFANNFAASFAPSIGKTVREIQDPLLREARTIVDNYRNRVPGLSQSVPVKYDFRGKPELTPILSLYSRSEMDDIDVEVLRLSQLGGKVDTFSSRDRKFYSAFTNKEGKTAYARYGELLSKVGSELYKEDFEGKTLTQAVQEVIKSEDYKTLADPFTSGDVDGQGGKVAQLREIISAYREAVEERLQVEGFVDGKGRNILAVQEEQKQAKKLQTQEEQQEFQQDQSSGSMNEQVQDFINQYNQ